MCDCTMIADGSFNPITIKENKLSFIYEDRLGVRKVLIKEFAMDITINQASVSEVKNEQGDIVAYEFKVW